VLFARGKTPTRGKLEQAVDVTEEVSVMFVQQGRRRAACCPAVHLLLDRQRVGGCVLIGWMSLLDGHGGGLCAHQLAVTASQCTPA